MEASTVPRAAPAGVSGNASPRLLRVSTDARLVDFIREGRVAAFEAVYDRHHRAILSFCRHMLGSAEEAEDAVQHTFLAAYNDLTSSDKPIHLRAWLFTIARNRCYSILRARREQPVGDLDETVTEGLAAQVERRQDLRDLVVDLGRLPEDQRAALVLSEMDALSHEQISEVLSVPKDKVKALVFQARESLVASRAARETDCSEIREQLSNLHGGALRRANLRRHLRECAGCREFRAEVDRQRRQLRVLLPVAPTLALKETVLAGTVGASTTVTAAGGGAIAGSLFKGGVVKSLIGAAIAGVGTAGTIVAVHDFQVGGAGGSPAQHRVAAHARLAPTRLVRVARAAPSPAAAPSEYVSRSVAPASVAPAATRGAIRSAHSVATTTTTSASTLVAVLHPLSPKGLSPKAITSPLLPATPTPGVTPPPASSSTPSSGAQPSQPSSAQNAPYLGASAFGSGAQPSHASATPPTPGAPATSAPASTGTSSPVTSYPVSTPAATSSSGQTQTGSDHGAGGHSTALGQGPSTTGHATVPSSGSSGSLGGRSSTPSSASTGSSSSSSGTRTGSPSTSASTSTGSSPASSSTTTSSPTAPPSSATTTTDPSSGSGSTDSSGSSGDSGSSGSSGSGGGSNDGQHGR